jgi:hypothetical protein
VACWKLNKPGKTKQPQTAEICQTLQSAWKRQTVSNEPRIKYVFTVKTKGKLKMERTKQHDAEPKMALGLHTRHSSFQS